MVLYDPMDPNVLQLVTSHPATDKKLFPRSAPDWAGDLTKLSDAQLRSVHAFTEFGINELRGETGTVSMDGNTVSKTAQIVANEYPHQGQGVFGGLTAQQRRQERYGEAEATLDDIEDEIQTRQIATGPQRGAGGGGGVEDVPTDFMPDGGERR